MNTEPNNSNQFPTPDGIGYLIVQVSTARGAIPLEGARVDVYAQNPLDESSVSGDRIVSTVSDRDGNTEPLPLPAPPRSRSQTPGKIPPYAIYQVSVFMEGFSEQTYYSVPVFSGITAIQPAVLIPLPDATRSSDFLGDKMQEFDEKYTWEF